MSRSITPLFCDTRLCLLSTVLMSALCGDGCSSEQSMGNDMSTLTPTLTSVTPASGRNSMPTNITLTGTGFSAGATITVNGAACANVNVVSSTQLNCTAPAQPATCGTKAVVVTNSDSK